MSDRAKLLEDILAKLGDETNGDRACVAIDKDVDQDLLNKLNATLDDLPTDTESRKVIATIAYFFAATLGSCVPSNAHPHHLCKLAHYYELYMHRMTHQIWDDANAAEAAERRH